MHCTLRWGRASLPQSSHARSMMELAIPGAAQPCWWHAHRHAKETCHEHLCLQSRKASPEPAGAAAPGCSGSCISCTSCTDSNAAASHLFTCFCFPFPPSTLSQTDFPDRTSLWLPLRVLFPHRSSRHSVGVGWELRLPEGHCFVPTRCAEFLTLAPSEQPPASSWPCCNLDSQPFASPCSWFILLMFNVGFASLEEGYIHLGNICRAELVFYYYYYLFFALSLRANLCYGMWLACSSPASKFSAGLVSMQAFEFCH